MILSHTLSLTLVGLLTLVFTTGSQARPQQSPGNKQQTLDPHAEHAHAEHAHAEHPHAEHAHAEHAHAEHAHAKHAHAEHAHAEHDHAPGQCPSQMAKQAATHDHDDEPEHARMTIPAVSQTFLGIKTGAVRPGNAVNQLRVPGEFILKANAVEAIALPIDGFVYRHVEHGQAVKQGEVIAEVDSISYRTQKTTLETLQSRLEVLKRNQVVDAALTREAVILQAALPQVELTAEGRILLRSKHAGVVNCPVLAQGAFMAIGSEIAQVVDTQAIEFQARIAKKHALSQLPKGPISGYIVDTDGCVLTEPSAIRMGLPTPTNDAVYAYIPVSSSTPDHTPYVGMPAIATLSIKADHDHDHLQVPSSALVDDGIEQVVFVKVAAETFAKVPVEVFNSSQGWSTIHGAIHHDAQIVIRGAYAISQAFASQSGTKPVAGHFHADGVFHEGDDHE